MKDYIYSYLKYIFILCGLTAIYLFNNHAVTLVFLILAFLVMKSFFNMTITVIGAIIGILLMTIVAIIKKRKG